MLYVLALGSCLALVGVVALRGYQATVSMSAPYEAATPYRPVVAQDTPSLRWAKALASAPYPGQAPWSVGKQYAPAHPLTYETCDALGLPLATQAASVSAEGPAVKLMVQVYAPGEASAALETYRKRLGSCFSAASSQEGSPEATVLRYSHGAAFSRGDALVFLWAPSPRALDEAVAHYLSLSATTLEESGCLSLTTRAEDERRNLFTQGRRYQGLILQDTVGTKRNLKNVPVPRYQNPRTLTSMEIPEGPLDPSIPREPQAPPERPEAVTIDLKTAPFTRGLSYQAPDPTGPGCGWAWSGQKAPQVDTAGLELLKTQAYERAQETVDEEATQWVTSKLDLARESLGGMALMDTWNTYVAQVDRTHARWRWLNEERERVKTPWYNYVAAHDAWRTFDARKAEAQRVYSGELQMCQAKNDALAMWEAQWGDRYRRQQAGEFIPAQRRQAIAWVQATPGATPTSPPRATPAPTPTSSSSLPNVPTPTPSSSLPNTPAPSASPQVPEVPREELSIPGPPEGCASIPPAPSILGQVKGAEPQGPKLPEGVTIPQSWPQPSRG